MNFAGIALGAYMITAVVGLCFGVLQSILLKQAVFVKEPRKWLYGVKFGLWAVALVIMALISLPLLIVFVVAASITLLVGSAFFYHRAQKEAR